MTTQITAQQPLAPVVLHTDDSPGYADYTRLSLATFGINLDSYTTSEAAYQAAVEKHTIDGPFYSAIIADYNTESEMTGGQLIAKLVSSQLAGMPLVGDVLVLSSSAARSYIVNGLQTAFTQEDIDQTQTQPYLDQVQVFDKIQERALAELYVAMRVLHPDESRGLKREDLIRWCGFQVDREGHLISKEMFALEEAAKAKIRKFEGNELSFADMFNEIAAFRTEGRSPGQIK